MSQFAPSVAQPASPIPAAAKEVNPQPEPLLQQKELATEPLQALSIQCKLTIGAPDDPLEDQTGQMADRITRTKDTFLQKKCEDCKDEDENIQRKPQSDKATPILPQHSTNGRQHSFLQFKLSIGAPNDQFEREADLIADKVVQRKNEQIQHAAPSFIQKKCKQCEDDGEDVQRKHNESNHLVSLQRATDTDPISHQADSITPLLQQSKGGGQPLHESTKTFMEQSIGADFSGVRIHDGSSAQKMTQTLQAQAFTNESDIYFNSGKYNTTSTEGMHLLAHELTHTVQQQSAPQQIIQRQTEPSSLPNWKKLPESVFVVVKEDFFFSETPEGSAVFQSKVLTKGQRLELTWKSGDWYFAFSEEGAKGFIKKTNVAFPPEKMPVEEFAGIIGGILFIQAKDMHRAFVLAKKSGLKPNIGMVFWYSNGKVKPYPVNYEITIREPNSDEISRMQALSGFSSLGGSGAMGSASTVVNAPKLADTPERKKWKEAEALLMPYANEYLLASSKNIPGEMLMNVPNESYFEYFNLYQRFCKDKGITPSDPNYEYYNTVLQLLIRAKIKDAISGFVFKPTDKMLTPGSMEWWVASKQLLVIDNDAFLKAELEKIIAEENEKRKADMEAFFKPYKDRFKIEQDEFLAKAKIKIDSISGWYQQEVERKAVMEVLKKRQDEYMAKAIADFQQSKIAKEIQAAVEKRYATLEKTITSPDPYAHPIIKADSILVGMLKLFDKKIAEAKDFDERRAAFASIQEKFGNYLSNTYPDKYQGLQRVIMVYYTEKLSTKSDGTISVYAIKNWAKLNSKDLEGAIERFSPIFHKRFNKDLETMRLMSQHSMTTQAYVDLGFELKYAKDFFDKVVDHPENDEGFWDGFTSKSLGEFIPFIHSILSISKLYEVMRVSNKSLMGGTLTVSEQLLLQAYAALQQINTMKEKPFWYKVGEGVADAIPFIGEFILTAPIGLGTGAIAEKAMEATVRKMAVQFLEKRMVKFIIKGVGVLAGSLVQTLANPLDIEKNILANKMNIVSLVQNEDGSITIEVQANKESEASAAWKGFITSYINVFTERLGGKVLPFVGSKVAGAFTRFVPMVVRDRIVTASMKKVAESLSKYAGFHGILGEYEEEVYGQILEALLTGKQLKWSTEDQLQTFSVVAIVGSAMRGLQTTIVAYDIIRTFRFKNKNIVLPAEIYTKLSKLTNASAMENFKEEIQGMKLSTEQRELALMLAQQTLNIEHEIHLSEQEQSSLHPKAEMPKTLKQLHQFIIALYKSKQNMLVQLQEGKRIAESVLLFGEKESVPLILYNVDQANQWIKETEAAIGNLEATDINDAKKAKNVDTGVLENIAFWTEWTKGWRPYLETVQQLSPDSKVVLSADFTSITINGNVTVSPKMLQRLLQMDKQNLKTLLETSLHASKATTKKTISDTDLKELQDENEENTTSTTDTNFILINNEISLSKDVLELLLPIETTGGRKGKKRLSVAEFLFTHSKALSYQNTRFNNWTPQDLENVRKLSPDSTVSELPNNRLSINGQIEVSTSFMKELMAQNINEVTRLLEATLDLQKQGGQITKISADHRGIIVKFSSSSGYRMRFLFQYETENQTFINQLGAQADSRFQTLWLKADFHQKIRFWDLYNEIAGYDKAGNRNADKLPELRKQAMDFALSMEPSDLYKLVDFYQFYKAYFVEETEKLAKSYLDKIEKFKVDFKAAHGKDPSKKEIEDYEKKTSLSDLGREFTGKNQANEAASLKIAEQMRDASKGPGFIKDKVQRDLAKMFEDGRIQLGGRIGTSQVATDLNDQDLIKAIKSIPNLSFADETSATYHVLKHHSELPDTLQDSADPTKAYIEAARKTVSEATQTEVSFAPMDYGTRSVMFTLSIGSHTLTAIVRCTVDGKVSFATLMIKKTK